MSLVWLKRRRTPGNDNPHQGHKDNTHHDSKTYRGKTLDYEAKAGGLGSAPSAQKASKQQTKEHIEALSKRERQKARQQLKVAGLEDGEVLPEQEEGVSDPENDDALADDVNVRNDFEV